jgi:hypothetical protein
MPPKESSMPLLLRFGFAAQVVAAFVIFVLGYVGLFVTLMLLMLLIRGLYESAKWIRASAARGANSNPFTSTTTSVGTPFERRAPDPITSPANQLQLAEIAFHPALNRRRVDVAVHYSSNLPGGTPR